MTITKPTLVVRDRSNVDFAVTFDDGNHHGLVGAGGEKLKFKKGHTLVVPCAERTDRGEGKKALVRVTPAYTATAFGTPACAQLRLSTAPEIRRGAEDGGEMGVWNLLQQSQREANLGLALDEYLHFGLEARVQFVN